MAAAGGVGGALVGELRPNDPIVLVAVWSEHRAAAFSACRSIMEELKSKAPLGNARPPPPVCAGWNITRRAEPVGHGCAAAGDPLCSQDERTYSQSPSSPAGFEVSCGDRGCRDRRHQRQTDALLEIAAVMVRMDWQKVICARSETLAHRITYSRFLGARLDPARWR